MKSAFYKRFVRRGELTDLEGVVASDVQDEIMLVRIYIRRLLEGSSLPPGDENAPSLKDLAYTLSVLALAANRLADLCKKQKFLGGEGDDISRAISQALAEVTKELNIT